MKWWPDMLMYLRRRSLDADAVIFFGFAGITDPTQKSAVNTLVLALKAAGVWSKCTAIYPFVGGTATAHSRNLRSTAFTITWNGIVTHNANGVTGNGSTGYGDTGVTSNVLGRDSAGIFLCSKTAAAMNQVDCGATDGTNFLQISARTVPNTVDCAVNSAVSNSTVNADGSGVFVLSRIGSTTFNLYVRGAKTGVGFSSVATVGLNVYVCARNNIGAAAFFSARNFSMFGLMNQSLTDADELALRNAIVAFNTTLGR
jgi:hypothetical protein